MYVIRTQKLASHLMNLGYKLIKTDICKDNPNLNVFLFKDTKELRESIEKYKTQ